jgi:hypothetical protein
MSSRCSHFFSFSDAEKSPVAPLANTATSGSRSSYAPVAARRLGDHSAQTPFPHDSRRNAGHGVGTPDPVDRRHQERAGVELEATLAPRPNATSRQFPPHEFINDSCREVATRCRGDAVVSHSFPIVNPTIHTGRSAYRRFPLMSHGRTS